MGCRSIDAQLHAARRITPAAGGPSVRWPQRRRPLAAGPPRASAPDAAGQELLGIIADSLKQHRAGKGKQDGKVRAPTAIARSRPPPAALRSAPAPPHAQEDLLQLLEQASTVSASVNRTWYSSHLQLLIDGTWQGGASGRKMASLSVYQASARAAGARSRARAPPPAPAGCAACAC
jgi:hypothetical protein